MGLFSKKPRDPAETCPTCGEPKPASLPTCTSCKMKSASAGSAARAPPSGIFGQAPPPRAAPPPAASAAPAAPAPAPASAYPSAIGSPDCPVCGGPKPASLPVCTTCKMKEAADRNPLGFPGSEKEKAARRQGTAWTPPPPPGRAAERPAAVLVPGPAPPPLGQAPPPFGQAPPPFGQAPPASGARPGSFGDPYALSSSNFPVRAKSGVPVRNAAEGALADLLYDAGIACAYEPLVANHRPTFLVASKNVVIEVSHDLSPLADWQRAERAAAYRAYGFTALHLDARRPDFLADAKRQLASHFPERAWA